MKLSLGRLSRHRAGWWNAFVALVIANAALTALTHASASMSEGRKQCEAGDYQHARKTIAEEVKREPNDAALWNCLGRVNQELGDSGAAVAAYRKSLALNPKAPSIWFRLAEAQSSQRKIQQAVASYRKGLAQDPTNPSANKDYALLLMKSGAPASAISPLQIALKAESESKPLRLALIEAYLRTGKPAVAEDETKKFLEAGSTDDQLALTSVLIGAKQFDRAQTILIGLSQSKPDLPDAHAQLGLVLMEQNQFEAAALELGQAVQAVPDSLRYSLGLAEVLLRWHHYSTVLEFLNAVKPRFESLPEFQYDVAYAYYGMRNFESAVSTVSTLLKQHPRYAAAELLLGNCYVAQGDLTKAESHFVTALQQDASNPATYAALAQVKRYQGKTTEAIGLLKKGLALDPSDADLIFELALCHEAQGDLAKAQALLEQLVAANPALIKAHRALVRVYGRAGNSSESDREKKLLAEMEARTNAAKPNEPEESKQ